MLVGEGLFETILSKTKNNSMLREGKSKVKCCGVGVGLNIFYCCGMEG